MISLRGVSLVYPNGVHALDGVSLEIGKGEFVFLVGHSGTGKSSLLRLLYREMAPTNGQILVDGNGKTLYLFEADTSTQSTCSGGCAQAWPPVTTNGAPKAAGGASASLLGTTARSDGTTQVTFGGHPLYSFTGDTKPGDTNGEGSTAFGAGWDVLTPTGEKIEKSASSGSY